MVLLLAGAAFGGLVEGGESAASTTSDVFEVVADVVPCEATNLLVNPCRPWLGASANKYPQVAAGLRPQIEYHEQRIGQQVDLVHAYNSASTTGLSADQRYFATRPGTILFLNWKPALVWANADGSNATVNASIDATATSIKALGEIKIFLTLHHEPENDVSGGTLSGCSITAPGSAGTTEEYRAMWRNVRARFDAQGVTNVVWAINYMSYQPYNCMIDDLYPGNELVDWVFFDNYGSGQQPTFVQNVARTYDLLTSTSDGEHNYLSKHWGIAEWNIRKGSVTPQQTYNYYDEAKLALEANRFPRIDAYMVWDSMAADGSENRILYQQGGFLDPVRQEHYVSFASSSAFDSSSAPEPDVTAPTVPSMTNVTADSRGVTVEWGSSTDNVMVTGYEVFRDGQLLAATATTSFVDPDVSVGNTYTYAVRAFDDSQNRSGLSESRQITVTDHIAPTAPGTPTAVVNTDDSIFLSWAPSADDVGVTGYEIWRQGTWVGNSGTASFTDQTTRQGQSYTFAVYGLDAAGNRSVASPSTVVSVPDQIAPTAPTSLAASSPAKRTVRLTWTASTDNVAVAGYDIYRDTTRLATVSATQGTTYTVKNLTSGRTYAFSVRAFDAANLLSSSSNVVMIRAR